MFLLPFTNNPSPFFKGCSFIYSSFGGSPPNDKEFKESIIMLIIRIRADVKKEPVKKTGYKKFIARSE